MHSELQLKSVSPKSHGRNTVPQKDGNIGTTAKLEKVSGVCHKPTKTHSMVHQNLMGMALSIHMSYNNRTSTALTLQTFIPAQREIEDENTPGTEAYHNKEEAKKDFIRLLRKSEIEPTSQWNEVLPQIIKNPAFRGVKDPVERKQLFENYLVTLRTEVQEKEKDRRHRVREGFMQMCRRHHEIKHYTRY